MRSVSDLEGEAGAETALEVGRRKAEPKGMERAEGRRPEGKVGEERSEGGMRRKARRRHDGPWLGRGGGEGRAEEDRTRGCAGRRCRRDARTLERRPRWTSKARSRCE